jgi:hypothetical protein
MFMPISLQAWDIYWRQSHIIVSYILPMAEMPCFVLDSERIL